MTNAVVWVDIPVLDLDRAVAFYEKVLGGKIEKMPAPAEGVAVLPREGDETSGCLVQKSTVDRSENVPLVYLNVQGRLAEAEEAVASSGGEVLAPKHAIGSYGFRSIIRDCEGNRIALHSM